MNPVITADVVYGKKKEDVCKENTKLQKDIDKCEDVESLTELMQ